MKIVIDIPEEQFTTLNAKTQAEVKTVIDYELLAKAIKNGIPYNTSGDLISREALINNKPEFMNEKVVQNTKYRTAKNRIYAKAWNACNNYWLDTLKNAPTVERPQGEWIRKGDSKWHCSKCGAVPEFDGTTNTDKFNVTMSNKYCRLCGADMRKGGTEWQYWHLR